VIRVLLIGYGNTLRGDDALGPMALERLRTTLPEMEYISCHQLGPELAERLAACDLAVFVDASGNGEPGAVHVVRLSPEPSHAASFTHHVQPTALLHLAKELYGRAPQAMLVTGTGATFDSGEELSAQGQLALDRICRLVPLLVRDFPAMW
jgi:hydrogenase maturation protease